MGTAAHRSWSFSRQQAYDWCPRNFFWSYFRTGEPESDMAWFLSLRTSVEQLSGDIVHEAIRRGFAQYKFTNVWPDNLIDQATSDFDRRVALSSRVTKCILNRKSPPRKPWLGVHLDLENPDELIARGRESVERCIRNFESSDVFEVIKASDPRCWHEITAPSHERPHIITNIADGFLADGLRIYTAYDFALKIGDITYILDWKTSETTKRAITSATFQLWGYALWASRKTKGDLTKIRIQPVWLYDSPPIWNPMRVKRTHILKVRKKIINQDRLEKRLVRRQLLKSGELYTARREDFPMKQEKAMCRGCKFSELCWDD